MEFFVKKQSLLTKIEIFKLLRRDFTHRYQIRSTTYPNPVIMSDRVAIFREFLINSGVGEENLDTFFLECGLVSNVVDDMYMTTIKSLIDTHVSAQKIAGIILTERGSLIWGPDRPKNKNSWVRYRKMQKQFGIQRANLFGADRFGWCAAIMWHLISGDMVHSWTYKITITACAQGMNPRNTVMTVPGPHELCADRVALFAELVNVIYHNCETTVTIIPC